MRAPVFPQHLRTENPVRKIRFRSRAENSRRMAAENPDVMQQRSRGKLPEIHSPHRTARIFRNRKRLLPDLTAVPQKKTAQRCILRIKKLNHIIRKFFR